MSTGATPQVPAIWAGITRTLHLEKTTAGTAVYTERGVPRPEQTFPTIYVQKHALTDPPPASIEVTIKAK